MAKILLIDDELDSARFTKMSLERKNYEVILVSTATQALEAYKKEGPDVVLLDLGLPDMDGREVLKEIKRESPDLKIIVISGYKDKYTQEEMSKLGADYFLGKPFNSEELFGILKEIFLS